MKQRAATIARSIDIIGADANNLHYINVSFPLNRISIVTGVSGSGKSSLLADTLAAEGSRRTRLYLGMSQPDVERDDVTAFIGAMPPTVLVGQRGFRPSVRTTIGTATGYLAVLRNLFVRLSVPRSEFAGEDVPPPSASSYAEWLANHYRGELEVWAVPVRRERTDGIQAMRRLAVQGIATATVFTETRGNISEKGRYVDTTSFKGLSVNVPHTIEALVGTTSVHSGRQAAGLHSILNRAFQAGRGRVVVMLQSSSNPRLAGPFGHRLDSTKHWVHPNDPAIYAGPSAHLLSFNAPEHEDSGACPSCRGTGIGRAVREEALVTHPEKSMAEGAFALWTEKNYKYLNIQHDTIRGLAGMSGFSPDVPWAKLPRSAKALLLDGTDGTPAFDIDTKGRRFGKARPFVGFRKIILDKSSTASKTAGQVAAFVDIGPCDECGGTRWSFEARALQVNGLNIAQLLAMSFTDAAAFFAPESAFTKAVARLGRDIVHAAFRHARSIGSVGLGYLTGDRGMHEVSEGESRRTRLSRVLDADETGLCLLLDEPGRGLHEADLPQLVGALRRLRDRHTIVINEHREGLWKTGDWFVELGPGAGSAGGKVIQTGAKQPPRFNESQFRRAVRMVDNPRAIAICGASIHNITDADCTIPLGRLTCVCGVSGSGKSSFIRGILAPALFELLGADQDEFAVPGGKWRKVVGGEGLHDIVPLDQRMPPPNRRSLVATYVGVFDAIRARFALSPLAIAEGLSASDFGVNVGTGRCPTCVGVGEIESHGHWSACPACGGARYGHAALSVRVDGFNIQELLITPFAQLTERAGSFSIPLQLIDAIRELGIGHLCLGRRIDTLSGGEVQRLRLAMRLAHKSPRATFFLLDEPAVGLHPRDIPALAKALDHTLDDGRNTMVIVEHDLTLIRFSDWVIEFGPGSGPDGGKIVFSGTPADLAKMKTATGLALSGHLLEFRDRKKTAIQQQKSRSLSPRARERNTKVLLSGLFTGNGPEGLNGGGGNSRPALIVSEQFWSGRRDHEIAGLDSEVPKLLLDVQLPRRDTVFEPILLAWKKERAAWLAIHPFLTEMQTWGSAVPTSVLRSVTEHINREKLHLVTSTGAAVGRMRDVRRTRATGERFVPAHDGSADADTMRMAVLRDAFAIGANYVELRDSHGRLLATATNRLVDLERAIVAPMSPIPPEFSRLDPRGWCPMCSGAACVTTFDEALIIGRVSAPPDDERFLTRQASAISRGVTRNTLRPFLKRLAAEQLWNGAMGFNELDRDQQNMIRFGFWSRPGPGSFLKKRRDDPSAVASWLRWDGLFRHVADQLDRSSDREWVRAVKESAQSVVCPLCAGSGFLLYAELLKVGGLPFTTWSMLSNSKHVIAHLRDVPAETERQKRTKARIIECLTLSRSLTPSAIRAKIASRVVQTFTTIEPVTEADADDLQ